MNDILSILYDRAIESRDQYYLKNSDLEVYRNALHSKEEFEEQLKQLLQGESLRLFNLYQENSEEGQYYSNVSAFRRGLAMGLKLGVFPFWKY